MNLGEPAAVREVVSVGHSLPRSTLHRWDEPGYDGLFDRRTQQPSPKRVPVEQVGTVLRLHRERYFDFNVTHFVEISAEDGTADGRSGEAGTETDGR